MKGAICPTDSHVAHVFLCMIKQAECGNSERPQNLMRRLSNELDFEILGAVPQSMFDGWSFWIRFDKEPDLPDMFRDKIKWVPVGAA